MKINVVKNKGKKKTTYTARIQIDGVRKSITKETKKEVEKAIKEMYYQVETGLEVVTVKQKPRERITLDTWFEIWIKEYKELTVKARSVDNYKRWYRNHISPMLGGKYIDDITVERLQNFFNNLSREKALSSSSIQYTQTLINNMLKQAYINERIDKNPCEHVQKVKRDKPKKKNLLNLEHEKTFFNYFNNENFKNVCVMALYTGMRANEILALKWEDIDIENKIIHVRHTLVYKNKQNYKLTSPKSETSLRDIPMTSNVYKLLQLKKDDSTGFVFNEYGIPFNYNAINTELNCIIKKMNEDGIPIKHISMHSFRHTFTTRCIENGMTPKVLQTILGHADVSLTMNLYTHCQDKQKQKEMMVLENII